MFIHETILNDKRLSTTDRFLIALITFRDQERGCFATNQSLAAYLNCSTTTVSRSVLKLAELGYIRVNVPDWENGGRAYIRRVRHDIKNVRSHDEE